MSKGPKSGLRAKAEAILLVEKATKSKMRSAVDGEQPSKPRPALHKCQDIPSPVFLMLILHIEKLPSPKGIQSEPTNL